LTVPEDLDGHWGKAIAIKIRPAVEVIA